MTFDVTLDALPPLCLVYTWLFVCASIAQPTCFDFIMNWIFFFSKYVFSLCILIDCYYLARSWFRRMMRPTLEPQMGFSKMDPYLKEAIQVWCLFECLRSTKTRRGMVAAITQYLQSHVHESLPLYIYRQVTRSSFTSNWYSTDGTDKVEEMIEAAFGSTIDEIEGELVLLETQDGEVKDAIPWHCAIDSAFTNWKDFRSSTVAKKMVHLVNVIVSSGMCATADLTFKMGNVALFSPIVSKKQLEAADVFEAFYEAISGFMKGGWRVFQTGDVSAFFVEDDKISEFDSMYNNLRSWHGYAIAGNLREYTEITDNDYEEKLKKAITFGEGLLKVIKRTQIFERKYVSDRLDKLRDNETEFTQLRTRGGLRIAPFAVCFFGQSGCGKSSLTNLTVNAGLIYNDLSAEKDRIATWADNDKFASSIRSHINAIIFDDFANTRAEFMDFSPAYRLIQVINNIKYLAPMADVFLKGKVSLNPYFCIVSTNVEHLNAAVYSNEPESVLRRLYHVKVIPKPEFCVDGILNKKKIEEKFGTTSCPDVWDLSVRSYTAQNKRHVDLHCMTPVEFEGQKLENITVKTYLRWLQVTSKQHFTEEGQYLANQEAMPTKCKSCSMVYCDCKNPVLEKQAGEFEYYSGNNLGFFHRRAEALQDFYQRAGTTTLLAVNEICLRVEAIDWLPERVICHPWILKCGLMFWTPSLMYAIYKIIAVWVCITMALCLLIPRLFPLMIVLGASGGYIAVCTTTRIYKEMVKNGILRCKDVVKTFVRRWETKYAIIGLGAIGIILATLRSRYTQLDAQTGLDPQDMFEVNERNAQVNPWMHASTVPLPMSEPAKTTSASDLSLAMRTNLIGIVSDKGKTTLGFFITSNVMIVPTHFLNAHGERDVSIKCYKRGNKNVGDNFRDKISLAFSYNIPDTDFTACFITSGGSMKDFRHFLPEDNELKKVSATVVTRGIIDSAVQTIPAFYKGSGSVAHTEKVFAGGYYNLAEQTKNGMCMSPVISAAKGSVILGFHLGGKGRLGGCGTLTKPQVDNALFHLSTVEGVVLSASCGDLEPEMGVFPTETFGKPIFEGPEIHPKSAVNYLLPGSCIDIYGKTSGKATPHSNVAPTVISDAVEEVFGVPQQWGPPKMKGKGNYPYQATLEHAAIPSLPIGSVLSKAVASMNELTTNLKAKLPELFQVGPLSRVATVSGLIGTRFIEAMNFGSSPGFPFSGTKQPLLVDLNPEEYPESGCPRTFVPHVWEEFEKICQILMSGYRCYLIWKSCLKDEATKLTKDKVRVFQSAPLVLQLIIRMYFLPIVRIIQLNPILYECAVGVNAEGLEWEELWEAAMSKGKSRVLAGDYSKYDVRMPAQATIAAFDILINIAEKCDGYSEDDIHLMKMVVNEVVYPVMAYNGDLIQLFGTNPSGQNLTVIINSLVNSLLLRSCFFTIYPDKDFKEHTAFITYGDDVIGTVSKECSKFTHITYAEWLKGHDMQFTMPDKTSEPKHYMEEEEVDFLKRKTAFNPDLGRKVGLLSEESIYKRLHSHLLSKELSLEEHSAQNIESSLHDWFYYGREVFEDRKEKLTEVAKKCEIEHLCPALSVSYDKRVNRWRHKYLGEELEEDESAEDVLEMQCGDLYVGTYDYLDHCIGSGYDIHYWWEFYADWSSAVFVPLLWYCTYNNLVSIKLGWPRTEWIYAFVLLTGGMEKRFALCMWFFRLIVLPYLPTLMLHYYPLLCQKFGMMVVEWYFSR